MIFYVSNYCIYSNMLNAFFTRGVMDRNQIVSHHQIVNCDLPIWYFYTLSNIDKNKIGIVFGLARLLDNQWSTINELFITYKLIYFIFSMVDDSDIFHKFDIKSVQQFQVFRNHQIYGPCSPKIYMFFEVHVPHTIIKLIYWRIVNNLVSIYQYRQSSQGI